MNTRNMHTYLYKYMDARMVAECIEIYTKILFDIVQNYIHFIIPEKQTWTEIWTPARSVKVVFNDLY